MAINAVHRLVKARLAERNMTGRELARKLGIHESALSHAISLTQSRSRNLGTLDMVSAALGWRRDYLRDVLTGEEDPPQEIRATARTKRTRQPETVPEFYDHTKPVGLRRTIRDNVRLDTEQRKRAGYGKRIAGLEAEVTELKAAVAVLLSKCMP